MEPITIDVTTTSPDLVIPGSIGPTWTGAFGSAVGAGAPPTTVGWGPDLGTVRSGTVLGAGSAEPLEHAPRSGVAAASTPATNIAEAMIGRRRMREA